MLPYPNTAMYLQIYIENCFKDIFSLIRFCLWADGRKSWIKQANLPLKIQDCLQGGETYLQKVISLDEFEQRLSQYQTQITTTGKSTYDINDPTPPVKR